MATGTLPLTGSSIGATSQSSCAQGLAYEAVSTASQSETGIGAGQPIRDWHWCQQPIRDWH